MDIILSKQQIPKCQDWRSHLLKSNPEHRTTTGVLSPLLYSFFKHNCSAIQPSINIVKSAKDTILVGLITKNSKTAYREDARHLGLNTTKMKEMIIDFRKSKWIEHFALCIGEGEVERVGNFKLLGVYSTTDLKWTVNIPQQV